MLKMSCGLGVQNLIIINKPVVNYTIWRDSYVSTFFCYSKNKCRFIIKMYAGRAIKVLFKCVILVNELFIVYYFAIRSNTNIALIKCIALYIL